MLKYCQIALISLSIATSVANAGPITLVRSPSEISLNPPFSEPHVVCGAKNAEPTAILWDADDRKPPQCDQEHRPRQYVPKYKGLAYDILNFESEACFVPDVAFQILDDIVTKVVERVTAAGVSDIEQKILLISRTTSAVLSEIGFALWIPTETLSDAMFQRRAETEKFRHIFDCDTGSMILLTIGEALDIKAFLVESTIPSNNNPRRIVQHNFVSWPLNLERSINWDMNAKEICKTPTGGQLPYQGQQLTKRQLWG
jgi:hypothetical protein